MQVLRSKRVTDFDFGFLPCFAGFLQSQSATDWLWIGMDWPRFGIRGQVSGFSGQKKTPDFR